MPTDGHNGTLEFASSIKSAWRTIPSIEHGYRRTIAGSMNGVRQTPRTLPASGNAPAGDVRHDERPAPSINSNGEGAHIRRAAVLLHGGAGERAAMENGCIEVLEDIAERLRALGERQPEIDLELRRYADDLDRVARELLARDTGSD